MKISELAAKTGTTVRTLRFYEEASLLAAPMRTLGGYRDYDASAVSRIQFVKAGQAVGLTLAEIRNLINIRADGVSPCRAATELLDQHLAAITQRISELQSLKKDLAELRARASSLDPDDCPPDNICHVINPHHSRSHQ